MDGDLESPIPTTQDHDSFEYFMNHKHRGMAIIFNHFKFDCPKTEKGEDIIEQREGTVKDVKELRGALKLLGFKDEHIKVEDDLTAQQIIEYPTKISNEDREILKNSDCIVIFVLSHGANDNKILARDMTYDLHELIEQYTPNKFAEMAGKPKLFFIGACRGKRRDAGVKLQTTFRNTSHVVFTDCIDPTQRVFLHPVFADILIGFSSHHDHKSCRNKELGSRYIQGFCEAITHYHQENNLDLVDIVEIITYAHYLVSQLTLKVKDKQEIVHQVKQIPNFHSALCRKLCFTKKENV